MDALFAAFGIDWKLLLAQGVNFALLLGLLWYFLYKPVLATLDARAKKIADGVAAAERAEEKLAGADTEAAARITAADKEAGEVLSAARAAGQHERSAIVKEAEARAVSIEADADARAKETAARALRESEKEIARLAILAAAKAVAKE